MEFRGTHLLPLYELLQKLESIVETELRSLSVTTDDAELHTRCFEKLYQLTFNAVKVSLARAMFPRLKLEVLSDVDSLQRLKTSVGLGAKMRQVARENAEMVVMFERSKLKR